ncbi:MAG: zinc ribbon domain-containing protein [Solirubrobacterales bacterium]
MPIYEYRRPDGTTFEVIQKFSDDPLTKDPETGVPVERVYTAPAIHFKGSGFHNTDYSSNRRAKAGQGAPDESGGSSSGSSESKSSESSSESKSSGESGKSESKKSESKKKGGDSK